MSSASAKSSLADVTEPHREANGAPTGDAKRRRTVASTRGDCAVNVEHEPGNLRLIYVQEFVPRPLYDALCNYVQEATFISKVGEAQGQRYPHVSKNAYRWEVQADVRNFGGAYYNFSRNHFAPLPPMAMGSTVQQLGDLCWQWACANVPDVDDGQRPNAALLNWYPDGAAGLGAHGDNDPWFGGHAVLVLSVSIGAERTIKFRARDARGIAYSLKMHSGSLVAMIGADTQRNFTHEVTPQPSVRAARFNFTFRHIRPELFGAQHAMRVKSMPAGELANKYALAYTRAAESARRPDGVAVAVDGSAWSTGWQAALAADASNQAH